MKCKNCGFITRGKERFCPICNEPLVETSVLEKQVNVFSWFYCSVRTLIFIIVSNLILLATAAEIIFNVTQSVKLHFFPFIFFGLYLLILLINNLLFKNADRKFVFLNTFILLIITSLLLPLSFGSEQIFNWGVTAWQFDFQFFYPIGFALIVLISMIYYLASKKFDILTLFFSALGMMIASSLVFGLSFIPGLETRNNPLTRILSDASFAFCMLVCINAIVLCVFRLKNKVYRK